MLVGSKKPILTNIHSVTKFNEELSDRVVKNELEQGKLKFKNMKTGEEKFVSVDEAIGIVRG